MQPFGLASFMFAVGKRFNLDRTNVVFLNQAGGEVAEPPAAGPELGSRGVRPKEKGPAFWAGPGW